MNFSVSIQKHPRVGQYFLSLFKTRIINLLQISCIVIRVQKLWWFIICSTYSLCLILYNFIDCFINNSASFLLPVIFLLSTGFLPWSLAGLLLAYLVSKSPRTLYSSEECLGSWMKHFFDFSVGLSACCFLCLPEISPFLGRVYNETVSPLLCLRWPERLASFLLCFL